MVPNKVVVRVVFTRPRRSSLVALAIRLLTWAPYSHVAFGVGALYIEAVDSGVELTSGTTFVTKNVIVESFDVTLAHASFWAALAPLRHKPYDWLGVVGIGWYRVLRYMGFAPKTNELAAGRDALFCSELVYRVLQSAGICPKVANPELLDPKRLLRLLESCASATRFR